MLELFALSLLCTVLTLALDKEARQEKSYKFIFVPLTVILCTWSLYGYFLAPKSIVMQYAIEDVSSAKSIVGNKIVTTTESYCIERTFYTRDSKMHLMSDIADGSIFSVSDRPVTLSMCDNNKEK